MKKYIELSEQEIKDIVKALEFNANIYIKQSSEIAQMDRKFANSDVVKKANRYFNLANKLENE